MKISLEKKKVNNMKYADLHIHSSYSDGVKSPEEIIDSAIKDNIKYISNIILASFSYVLILIIDLVFLF